MIYAPLSTHLRSRDFPLATGATLSADGQAMVSVILNGSQGVRPSAGTAGEVFVGFLNTQTSAVSFLPTTTTFVENLTVPAGSALALALAPVAGSVLVYDTQTNAVVAGTLSGSTYTLGVATSDGHPVRVTYRAALSVAAARALVGDVTPGGYSGLTVNQASVSEAGTIYTDQFDTSKDWSAATAVKLGANGLLTDQTGSGTVVRCAIVALPSQDYPFLGLEFAAL